MVKCSECGFLTLRDRKTGQLEEVIDDYRLSGETPNYVAYEGYHNWPICFAMAIDLFTEVNRAAEQQHLDKSRDWAKYVLGVIDKDRECPPVGKALGFTEYIQGFTPKEHREMLDRKQLLEWQVKREKDDKNFRKQENQSNRRYRIAELVLVILTIIAILATAFIGRGEPTINIITPNPPEVTIEQQP